MHLVLNGINGRYLRETLDNKVKETEFVEAAIAYATDGAPLFEWCWDNAIPLKFWGRFDETIPVSLPVLRKFLDRRSPNFSCKLIRRFHAKIIWWHGVGVYIGSANHTDPAWYNNIEAGTFFNEPEMIASALDIQLRAFFQRVDENASLLSEELYKAIEDRAKELRHLEEQDVEQRKRFLANVSIKSFSGLVRTAPKAATDRQRQEFLNEWFKTLQILRDIGTIIAKEENRPLWVPAEVPSVAQADQFLHAHYYNRVIADDGKSHYAEKFEENRNDPAGALVKRSTGGTTSQPRHQTKIECCLTGLHFFAMLFRPIAYFI
jgi:hypothetical protein